MLSDQGTVRNRSTVDVDVVGIEPVLRHLTLRRNLRVLPEFGLSCPSEVPFIVSVLWDPSREVSVELEL